MLRITYAVVPSVALALLALAVWSCGPAPSDGQQDRLAAREAAPGRHAIHTEQLHKIMSDLGRSSAQDWPQEMADLRSVQDEEARFREARQVASALAQAAQQIPGAVSGVAMTEQQRAEFLAGVEDLEQKAAQLEAAAAAHDLTRMRSTLGKIKMTCCGCHAQFCTQAVPLQFGKTAPKLN